MVYHAVSGKVPDLQSIFRDVSKLQVKHDLNVVGYWVPNDNPAWANTFIYLVAHPSQEEAKKNWDALHADPAFPEYRKQAAHSDGLFGDEVAPLFCKIRFLQSQVQRPENATP
jgi:hypothetical protein